MVERSSRRTGRAGTQGCTQSARSTQGNPQERCCVQEALHAGNQCMQERCCVPTCRMHAMPAVLHMQSETTVKKDGDRGGGARERVAADLEDGDDGGDQDDVGRGQELRRQVREDGERLTADLEDGDDGDDDEAGENKKTFQHLQKAFGNCL